MPDWSETVPRSAARVFLHIEHRLLREALVRLFRKRSDIQIIGQGGIGELAVSEIVDAKCDVLVLSAERSGLPANFKIEDVRHSGFKVLLIGMDASEAQFLDAVRAGVTGFLLTDASPEDVLGGIRALHRGEAVCPPQLCLTLFRLVAEMPRVGAVPDLAERPDLTVRQQKLVALVAKGLTNKEIANQLNLSEFTVRNHIQRILKQVDAGNRTEAVEVIRSHGYAIDA